jgi:hypothetical protein
VSVAELMERLSGEQGTPRELASVVGLGPEDSTFRRAVAQLVLAGELVPVGSTRRRVYARPDQVPPGRSERDRAVNAQLLAVVPCPAREFSDLAGRLGLRGAEVHARKLELGLSTRRDENGRWVTAVGPPAPVAPRPGSEVFAVLALRAAKLAEKGIIGAHRSERERESQRP